MYRYCNTWNKLCTITSNLLDRSSISPRGPSLVMTSTVTMINGANARRIMVRENRRKNSKPYPEFYEIYRVFVNKRKQIGPSCLRRKCP